MQGMYTVSSSPHIKSSITIQDTMRDVVIALIPATIAGVYFFGIRALIMILLCVGACVGSEALWQKLTNKPITVYDLSAVVTGVLLAFNVPVDVPYWIPVVGGIFAIIIVKQFFGGLGQNFINPALAARAFLLASWPVQMTTWQVDGVTSATPLAILKEGGAAQLPSLFEVFVGHVGGCIGETSAIAILLGAGYLLYKRVITWRTPVAFIGTVFVLTWILGRHGLFSGRSIYEIFAGGLMLGAFFMATDYASSSVTPLGQIIFGIGCGLITTVIRVYGGYPEGVSYSILLMNLAVPLIDRYTIPRTFGVVKKS